MAAPWRDALKRGKAPLPPERRAGAGVATSSAPAIDPASVSPGLAALVKEREALQASIEAVRAGGAAPGGDPRFAVAPLAERRAEMRRWTDSREARGAGSAERAGRAARAPTDQSTDRPRHARNSAADQIRSIAGRMLGGLDPRATPAPPALRATPGETPGGGGTPAATDAFSAARDAARPLFNADAAPRRRAAPEPSRPRRRAEEEQSRPRRASGDPGSSGILDRAFDRWEKVRDKPRQVDAALDRARRAIPDEWAERARRAVPALGKGDGYDRRMKALLKVAVGTIDQVGEQSDKLRNLARDVRELRAADAANDEARRERAIERLKAKREEGA
ncbi:hypothetical protein [Allosphingosinicella deserti]|uniref:Uncharacterized protein n=1 Tax=Allosphingosinicella deserti TaxID=2116704 RepID=A0A2P7QLH4_9SPHN|nr:hypothetical protein [Sphingomonas deserti]PSJ38823.1 hypothetical protein C7I55_15970 [Sphingomonas deserti]